MGFTVPIMCDMFREELQLTMRSPDRGQIWGNIAAALNSLQQLEIGIHFNFKTKTKAARRREGLQNRIIQVVKNNNY